MKKTIAILLVAILAVSSVFAAFSGKASVGFGGNLDNGNFGFIDQSTNAKIDLELATANAENVGEGDIYASIKASLAVKLFNGEKGTAKGNPAAQDAKWLPIIIKFDEAKVGGENWYVSILGMPDGPDYAKSAIDTYDVKGKTDDYGFTKADYTENYTFAVPYADTNGIEIGLFGYKFGFGLLGDYTDVDGWKLDKNLNIAAFAETPEYDFGGLTVQAAATYSYKSFSDLYGEQAYIPTAGKYGAGFTINNDKLMQAFIDGHGTVGIQELIESGAIVLNSGYDYPGFSKTNAIGLAAKVGFANDTLSASLATDMGFNLEGDDFEEVFNMDVAANFNWSFLTLDAYYATQAKAAEGSGLGTSISFDKGTYTITPAWGSASKKDVLSFQAKFDLNTFDVPVALTASVKDVLHTVDLGIKAEVTPVEGLKLTASAGYVIDTIDAYNKADYAGVSENQKAWNDDFKEEFKGVFMGQWKFGLDAEYDFGFAKVAAGISAKNAGFKSAYDRVDNFDAAVDKEYENKTTTKDKYNYLANQVVLGMSASVSTESIIPGAELKLAWENGDDLLKVYQYNADADVYNYGKITASCTIEF